jgi:hypothetical protein
LGLFSILGVEHPGEFCNLAVLLKGPSNNELALGGSTGLRFIGTGGSLGLGLNGIG